MSSRTPRVSRRSFLAAAGGLTAGVLSDVAVQAAVPTDWNHEADVVVVGSGAAGLAAAVAASHQGAATLVLEKAPAIGGTTAKSGGAWWIADNHLMRRDGIADPRADAIAYMARCSFPDRYNPEAPHLGLGPHELSLIETYYDQGSRVTAELHRIKALIPTYFVGYDEVKYLDYFAHFPEDKAPRGRSLAPDDGKGGRASGTEMIRQLAGAAERAGTKILTSHRAIDLIVNAAGEVAGLVCEADGMSVSIRARKGVVFGSGGFTHNRAATRTYLRGPIVGGCAVPTNTGDFLSIAARLGADMGNMTHAWWSETVLEQAAAFASVPSNAFVFPGDSSILVNRFGRRVVNEKTTYNERTQVHFNWDPAAGEYPNLLLFLVYDQRVADNPGVGYNYPMPPKGTTAPYVIEGATLENLAANIDQRLIRLASSANLPSISRLDRSFVNQLKGTIARFNGFAETGVDGDFGRGTHLIDRSLIAHPPNGKPNPTMYPLSQAGPFYSIILAAGTLDTKGGPRIDSNGQVIRVDGQPIPGLYGAGNCVASPAGQAYWGGGGTLGPAVVFGYLAGSHAAASRVKAV